MKNEEAILVISSFVFITTLYIIIMVRGPRLGLINKHAYFDKTRLPQYFKFLAVVAVLSVPVGFLLTRKASLLPAYVGLNLLIAAIMGVNLFLYRRRSQSERHPKNK